MIDESKMLGDRCQWYTSMLGKYSSVEIIVQNLRGAGVDNWAVKDLVQGNKTRRWVVGWSWGSMRPSNVSMTLVAEMGVSLHSNRAHKGRSKRYRYATQASAPFSLRGLFYN